MATRLVVLDRDGVINHESKNFVKSADEWLPIAGSIQAIARLCSGGFTVAVATNQSGIGRGIIQPSALEEMHQKLRGLVREAGGEIGRIVFCPHLPDDGCDCRKPSPGMLRQIAGHYSVPLDGVPMIGDSDRDLRATNAVNGRPILVLSGNGKATAAALAEERDVFSFETYADLDAAASQLLAELGRGAG